MNEERSDAGFVLVGVLVFVLILSLLASISLIAARNNTRLVLRELQWAQASASADAVIERALGAILDSAYEPDGWDLNSPVKILHANVEVTVVVSGEGGKLDLNNATPATLRSGFEALGLPEKKASELAARIVDWRDPDDFRSLHGAEETDYKAEGVADGPENRPFLTVDEVRRVLGVTDEIYNCIKADLTIHSGRAGLDLGSLSDRLSGLQPQRGTDLGVSELVRRRPDRGRFSGDIVRIEAEARAPSGLTVMRRRIVRLTGDRTDPIQTLLIESGLPMEAESCGLISDVP